VSHRREEETTSETSLYLTPVHDYQRSESSYHALLKGVGTISYKNINYSLINYSKKYNQLFEKNVKALKALEKENGGVAY